MRYAVISDIHSNKQALNAVLADIAKNGVDEIFCLGDLIGYGPSPNEVIDIARKNIDHFVLGNHDAVVAGYINANNFNLSAHKLINWTISQLDNSAIKFFKDMPLSLVGNNVRFSHSEFKNPGRFGYITENSEALASFNACNESLLLTGHSHIPGIFVIGNSKEPHWLQPQNFGFEEEKRYIVNVGSVGQPRDEDIRASYCIIDNQKNDVLFHKVEFDIKGYRDDLIKHSLPMVSSFLDIYEEKNGIKSQIKNDTKNKKITIQHNDFTPLSQKDTVKIKTEVKNLQHKVLELNQSKKKLLLLVLLLGSVVACFATLFITGAFNVKQNKGGYIYKYSSKNIIKNIPLKDKNLLSMPSVIQKATANTPFKEWTISLSSPKLQQVSTILDENDQNKTIFLVSSKIQKNIKISSIPIPAKKGMRFNATTKFRALKFNSGFASIVIEQQLKDGSWKTVISKEPKILQNKEKWGRATSVTMKPTQPLKDNGNVRLTILMRFNGELLIKSSQLKRK